ncbi:MAG: glycosyltransferase family 4 protein [Methanoregulaceae archaeon]|nr:MAG: glycosyltransferase family 4 protein [Methanoregulaceae archaeon]
MPEYTLGLFANMYPAFAGDYRGIFIHQMVRDLENRGITVKKAVKTSSSVSGYIPFYWQSLFLARSSLDILQAEYIPHSSIIPAFLKKDGPPLVLKFHGDDARVYPFKNRFNLALTRSMLRRADHVITASGEIKQILTRIGGNPDRITALHTGVDTEFFFPGKKDESREQLGLLESGTIFVFVGRLHPGKGIAEILQVARACPDFLFVLIGPGNVPDHPDNCVFTGVLPPESVRVWLHAADCFILPTHTEAVPTSVMEAFACGVPAITTDVGGCPEIVETGVNGLMVPVKDIRALQEAVRWMGTHAEERVEMGKKARLTATEHYDHTILIEQLIMIHRSLMT